MNKAERFRVLLARGYFPDELPPPFHTDDLARFRASTSRAWDAAGDERASAPALYSVPRVGRFRRVLSIVNPVPQTYLTRLIADNWIQIRNHLRKSKISINKSEIEEGNDRAVALPDFALMIAKQIEISGAFDFALAGDLSRFYGTLYTHVIPWALHGKEWCKRNLRAPAYQRSLGNRLDVFVRKGQENQTIGIPVGPDTSRILSEIVGVSIDVALQEKLKIGKESAYRQIDDWYIGFDNSGKAEDAIGILAAACRTFELELNPEKTHTLTVSNISSLWVEDLRSHVFPGTAERQARSITHFFTKAFHYSETFTNQNVLDYAVKRTRHIHILRENWPVYESFLLKAARSNATVIPAVVQIVVSYHEDGFVLGRTRLEKFVVDTVCKNAPVAQHAEVAWVLFLAKSLGVSLSRRAARAVSGLENAVTALIALDLRQRGLITAGLDTTGWRLSMTQDGLRSDMWLLAYEADLKGWLSGTPANFVDRDPYFAVLKNKRVSFYDANKTISHIRTPLPARPSLTVSQFLRDFGLGIRDDNLATSIVRF